MVTSPSTCTVPSAFVSTLEAATVDLNQVAPVLLTVNAPSDTPVPTAPVNVTAPEPALTVNALLSEASESTVLPNKTGSFPALNTVFAAPIVTAPV